MIEPVTVLGQPAMRLVAPDGAQTIVLLHGAHIVSWIPAGDEERLYLSPEAVAGPGQAVLDRSWKKPTLTPYFTIRRFKTMISLLNKCKLTLPAMQTGQPALSELVTNRPVRLRVLTNRQLQ